MREIVETYNVYKFEELEPEAKMNALEKWYENGCEQEIQSDFFAENANEILEILGFYSEINYSLGYSQGDGCSFDFKLDSEEIINFLEKIENKKNYENGYLFLNSIEKELFEFYENFKKENNFEIKKDEIIDNDFIVFTEKNGFANRYVHSKTRYIIVDCEEIIDEKYIKLTEKLFTEIYYIICNKLEKQGYEQIYYRMSNEEFQENCDSNGYEFLENGEMI